MQPNFELPVLPMTAMDEITYRTPDALFNGTAVVNVIQSCVPNIIDAWQIPGCDLDTILVSIRIASYGHIMDMEVKCPKCGHQHDYGIDLRRVLDSFSMPDYQQSLQHGDLEIFFQPMSYQAMNEANLANFENTRHYQMADNAQVDDDEKIRLVSEAFKRTTQSTVLAMAKNIASIRTPGAIVTELPFFVEFLTNCDRTVFERIKEHILNLRAQSELKPLDIKCVSCEHQFTQPFTMDMTSFFADAS
jgi:hypothetical protein